MMKNKVIDMLKVDKCEKITILIDKIREKYVL